MTARKLQALRNLAERPGTEAEGEVARAMLAKAEGKRAEAPKPSASFIIFEDPDWDDPKSAELRAKMAELIYKRQMEHARQMFSSFGRSTAGAAAAFREFGEAARKAGK